MSQKKLYLIGGSKLYGSGKVINFLKTKFSTIFTNFLFIETQKSRFEIIKLLIKIPKNSKILFQPSICFPAFFRDILIMLIIRYKSKYIYLLLCVDIGYKNPILKNSIFRNLFFGNNVVMASADLTENIKNMIKITPYFEKDKLKSCLIKNLNLPIAALYLGYLNEMKGWNKFNYLMKKTKSSIKAIAIGKYPSKGKKPKSTKIEILKGRDTLEIEKNLETISNKYLPVLIFLSNEDFSPLIILESGYWGIPIVCINNSRGHQIIKRFLPANCFATIEKIEELHLKKSQFIKCKKNMFDYLNKISEEHFFYQVKSNLSLI